MITHTIGEQIQPEDQLLLLADIPLTLASVTRYQKGTSILKYASVMHSVNHLWYCIDIQTVMCRPNAFQVTSQDGHSKITLHCDDHTPNHLRDWVTAINDRIKETVLSEVRADTDISSHIIWMTWLWSAGRNVEHFTGSERNGTAKTTDHP